MVAETGGDGNRGAGLDYDFCSLPDGAHGLDYFGLTDGEDVLHVVANDFEGERAEGGLEAVGDGKEVFGDLRNIFDHSSLGITLEVLGDEFGDDVIFLSIM